MATVEHCLFCFEALSANLEKRPPMSLYQIQQSWSEYSKQQTPKDDEESSSKTTKLKKTLVSHLDDDGANNKTGASTPDSSSSSSTLSATTAQTTPSSSSVNISSASSSPSQITESPLFVTWNTVEPSSPHHKSLRGCIGTFESLPLSTAISSYALTSALSDHRFSPIALRELPTLSVSVTLLTDFEDATHPLDWEVGVHGIRVGFVSRGRRYGACYLPDVASEQGWGREEAVVSAMRKAGWGGRRGAWREVDDLEVVRFQGKVEHLEYDEYETWRKWEVDNGAAEKRR